MKSRSIGLKLTLWYAGVLAAGLLVLAAGTWLALNHSLYHAVDESLRDRVEGVRQFIEVQQGWLSLDQMKEEFREHSVLGPGGDLFQVADRDGDWLYRSDPLYDEHVPIYAASDLPERGRVENVVIQTVPLRFLSQNIQVGDLPYTVQVAAPLSELQEGLREFTWMLLPMVPLILLVASAGGYWLSRRALKPVDEITQTARWLSAENLGERLAVARTGDELERLSETLNGMLERLETSFQRMSRFTADASHELRTPLALVRTTADIALRSTSGREHREALEQINAEAQRMSQLVDNLLLIARADSGEARLHIAHVDLVDVFREAAAQGAVLARAKGIAMRLDLPGAAMPLDADPDALRRLFLILIDNAVKYTPSGGDIELSVREDCPWAVAAIRDTGIGIAADHLPQIFDRFYRVDPARSREPEGAGLGLAIGLWIAEAHGGVLSAESTPDRGSRFEVRLPMRPAAAEPSKRHLA